MPYLLVLRVRGAVNVRRDVREALARLNLRRKFNATVVPDTPDYMGALMRVKDYVAWWPATKEVVAELLRRRGRTPGWRPLTEEFLRQHGFSGFEELAEAIVEGRVRLNGLDWLKPYFSLSPPRGGFGAPTKRQSRRGGVLGENPGLPDLVLRMI